LGVTLNIIPTSGEPGDHGRADTICAARAAVRAVFDRWRAWAPVATAAMSDGMSTKARLLDQIAVVNDQEAAN
jgi:hypothetical protein